jgi:hypothetical protein
VSASNPPNPLDPDPETERRIRERARALWQQDGCPEGREQDYLERARELQAIADHPAAGLKPNPATDPDADRTVEEASIQENLGEFPNRFTDQGDRRMSPMTRQEEIEEAREDGAARTPGGG